MNKKQFVEARRVMVEALLGGEVMTIKQMTSYLNYRLDVLVSEAQVRKIAHSLPQSCIERKGGRIILKAAEWASCEALQMAMKATLERLAVTFDCPVFWERVQPHLSEILVISERWLYHSVQYAMPTLRWQWMTTGYGLMLRGVM